MHKYGDSSGVSVFELVEAFKMKTFNHLSLTSMVRGLNRARDNMYPLNSLCPFHTVSSTMHTK